MVDAEDITTADRAADVSIPEIVFDGLLPTLTPSEQLVYLRLFRRSRSQSSDEPFFFAHAALAAACNIGVTTLRRAVNDLAGRGLVVKTGLVLGGPAALRGYRYRMTDLSDIALPSSGRRGAAGVQKTEAAVPLCWARALERERAGWVYLLRAENGYYKIGRTGSFPDRVHSLLSIQIPLHVEFIGAIQTDDCVELERLLHESAADGRFKGEWFTLTDSQVGEFRRRATVLELAVNAG